MSFQKFQSICARLVAIVLAIGAAGWWQTRARETATSSVAFVSAFDEPMVVQISGADAGQAALTMTLRKNTPVTHALPAGTYRVRVTLAELSGKLVEEQTIEIHDGMQCAFYNVAGAAPIVTEQLAYQLVSQPTTDVKDLARTVMVAGPRYYESKNIDYCFVVPPDRISMDNRERTPYAYRVALLQDSAWPKTIRALAKTGQSHRAIEVANRIAKMPFPTEDNRRAVIRALEEGGLPAEAERLAKAPIVN